MANLLAAVNWWYKFVYISSGMFLYFMTRDQHWYTDWVQLTVKPTIVLIFIFWTNFKPKYTTPKYTIRFLNTWRVD